MDALGQAIGRFNRTTVECKCLWGNWSTGKAESFNRTTVECK